MIIGLSKFSKFIFRFFFFIIALILEHVIQYESDLEKAVSRLPAKIRFVEYVSTKVVIESVVESTFQRFSIAYYNTFILLDIGFSVL